MNTLTVKYTEAQIAEMSPENFRKLSKDQRAALFDTLQTVYDITGDITNDVVRSIMKAMVAGIDKDAALQALYDRRWVRATISESDVMSSHEVRSWSFTYNDLLDDADGDLDFASYCEDVLINLEVGRTIWISGHGDSPASGEEGVNYLLTRVQ